MLNPELSLIINNRIVLEGLFMMSKKVLLIFCVFFGLLFFNFSQQKITLGVGEFPPYISKSMKNNGFFCQIITEVLKNNNIEVEYYFVPWSRAIKNTEVGEFHGTPGWYRTREREEKFYISEPLVNDNQTFFHLKTYAFDWKNMNDLRGITIGTTIEYNYGEEFSRALKRGIIKVDEVAYDEMNFKKLLSSRIDIFPMNTLPGYYMLHKLFKKEVVEMFTNHPKPLRTATLHLLLSKKIKTNKQLLKVFNTGLLELKKSGKYQQYLDELLEAD